MIRQRASFVLFAAALLALPSLAPAADGDSGSGPPRVYTNADLERLEPLPQQQEPIAPPPSGEEWDLLVRMLEFEAQRNREARAEALERERFAAAQKAYERAVENAEYYGYTGGGYGSGGFWWGGGFVPVYPGGTTIAPTANSMLMSRLRIPMGQRGVHSAHDAFKEVRQESALRYTQPPIGRR